MCQNNHISFLFLFKLTNKLEESMSDFDYTSLTGDMLDVKIYTKVKDVQATIRIEFIEELNYPLMYVEDIN